MPVREPRWITEREAVAAIDLHGAVAAVRDALRLEHAGSATTLAKTATQFDGRGTLHSLGGAGIPIADGPVVGTKSWAHTPGGATPLVTLWDAASGALLGVVEAFALGQLRTAAISAVATDVMAPPDAEVLAMIGTGKQALAQVAAVASQRHLRQVRVHSPTAEHRAAFCSLVAARLADVDVVDCPDVRAAAQGGRRRHDGDPVANADPRRQHGRNARPCQRARVDHRRPPRTRPFDRRRRRSPRQRQPDRGDDAFVGVDGAAAIVSLSAIVAKSVAPGVDGAGLTVFKAMGLGLADVAIAAAVLSTTGAAGGGRPITAPARAAPRLFSTGDDTT